MCGRLTPATAVLYAERRWSATGTSAPQQRHVAAVGISERVALMKPQLLLNREARYSVPSDSTGHEALARIFEDAAVDSGLPAIAVLVERHRMEIHPSLSNTRQFDSNRAPIRLDLVTELGEAGQRTPFVSRVDGEIEIAVLSSLLAHERVNTPPAADPHAAPSRLKRAEDF